MGAIATIKSVAAAQSPTSPGASRSQATADPAPPDRLPGPVEPFASASPPVGRGPLAPFLTHLIATAHDAPQTRRLRRAAVSEALSAYAATTQRLEGASGATSGSAA